MERILYAGGLALLGSGYFLASKVTALWQFYVCISLLGGLGAAAIGMVPAAALISRWFERRLSTAIGIAYAGFGCGSLLIVPLAQTLIDADGWRDLGQVDRLLIDPPRDGALAVAQALVAAAPPGAAGRPGRIVYVSCNPATLARDVGLLVHTGGWRLTQAGVVNMFPHTAHVESIAVLE